MKIRVTFKTPDALDDTVDRAVEDATDDILDSADKQEAQQDLRANVLSACAKWVRHGEYVTIEIDTDAGTATVVPAK